MKAQDVTAGVNMALSQLITNSILDQTILNAMLSVPRSACVPERLQGAAYVDDELKLAPGRYLPAPLAFAQLLRFADVRPTDKVLDVGACHGYSTAVLALLAKEVIGVESDAEMAKAAKKNVATYAGTNARVESVKCLSEGFEGAQLYDLILVEGAIASTPATLLRQLAPDGRLVAVEMIAPRPGLRGGLGRLVEYLSLGGNIQRKESLECGLPLLPGFESKPAFTF